MAKRNPKSIFSAARFGWKKAKAATNWIFLYNYLYLYIFFVVRALLHRHRGQHVLLGVSHLQELLLVAFHVRLHAAGGHRAGCNCTLAGITGYTEEATVLCELHIDV